MTCAVKKCGEPVLLRDLCSDHFRKWYAGSDGKTPEESDVFEAMWDAAYELSDAQWVRAKNKLDREYTSAISALNKEDRKGSVYFIQDTATKFIKIGFTRGRIELRMQDLQCGNAGKLEVVSFFAGSMADERRLQKLFKASHVRGEWFRPDVAVMAYAPPHARADAGRHAMKGLMPEEVDCLRRCASPLVVGHGCAGSGLPCDVCRALDAMVERRLAREVFGDDDSACFALTGLGELALRIATRSK